MNEQVIPISTPKFFSACELHIATINHIRIASSAAQQEDKT